MSLSLEDRRRLGHDIGTIEFGWPVGMPLCRALGEALWEARSPLANGRIARVLFCLTRGELILLHAFVKKTQKTAPADMALARRRKKEIER